MCFNFWSEWSVAAKKKPNCCEVTDDCRVVGFLSVWITVRSESYLPSGVVSGHSFGFCRVSFSLVSILLVHIAFNPGSVAQSKD